MRNKNIEELSYSDYVKSLLSQGFKKVKLDITKISFNYLSKNESEKIFEIKCPNSAKLVLPSFQDISTIIEYGFTLKIIDKEGKEISGDTEIEIYKENTHGNIITRISNILYYNIRIGGSTMYHPMIGFELNTSDKLVFKLVNCDIKNINFEECKIYAKMDLFT